MLELERARNSFRGNEAQVATRRRSLFTNSRAETAGHQTHTYSGREAAISGTGRGVRRRFYGGVARGPALVTTRSKIGRPTLVGIGGCIRRADRRRRGQKPEGARVGEVGRVSGTWG